MAMKKLEKEQIFALAEMGYDVRPKTPWEFSDQNIDPEDIYYIITVSDDSGYIIGEWEYMTDLDGIERFMAEMQEHLSKRGA